MGQIQTIEPVQRTETFEDYGIYGIRALTVRNSNGFNAPNVHRIGSRSTRRSAI
jgi:hypothetical protein